jgi:hypothetical protein
MNSKQVNFFIMPEDLLEIELFLVNEGVLFIPQPIYDERNIYSSSVIRNIKPKINFGQVYLTHPDFSNKVLIKKIERQGYHLVNVEQSLAVEFDIGGFLYKPNQLERGRLYYITGYYEDKVFVKKDEHFIKWADRIFREVKKKFLKKGDSFLYYTQRTIDWKNQTGAKEDTPCFSIVIPEK